jgi:uncharacterized membrane protein HdeD (DUF308 family)
MRAFAYPTPESSEPMTAGWYHSLVWSLAMVVLGAMLLLEPAQSAVLVVRTMALFWLAGGVFSSIEALWERASGWGWRVVGGVVSMLVGLFVLAYPLLAMVVTVDWLYLVTGISAIVSGVATLASSGSIAGLLRGLAWVGIGAVVFAQPFEVLAMGQLVQWVGICAIVGGLLAGLVTVSGLGATTARS